MAVGIISSEIDFNEILNSNAYSIVDFFAG
jgi:hypothetical protein